MKTAESLKESLLTHTAAFIAAKKPSQWGQGTEKNPGAHVFNAAGWLKKEFNITIPDEDAAAFREALRMLANTSAFAQELDKLHKNTESKYHGKFPIGADAALSE